MVHVDNGFMVLMCVCFGAASLWLFLGMYEFLAHVTHAMNERSMHMQLNLVLDNLLCYIILHVMAPSLLLVVDETLRYFQWNSVMTHDISLLQCKYSEIFHTRLRVLDFYANRANGAIKILHMRYVWLPIRWRDKKNTLKSLSKLKQFHGLCRELFDLLVYDHEARLRIILD